MKSKKLFWGTFFLTLGGLWLLGKFDVFATSWNFIWKIWPFILILWGVAVFTKNTPYRQYVSAAFGFLIAFLIYGSISNITGLAKIDLNYDYGNVRHHYYENLDSTISSADIEINAGLSMIVIKDTTDKLIYGKAYGSFGEYNFNRFYSDSNVSVVFDHSVNDFWPFKGKFGNRLNIDLNKSIKWHLALNIGVSKSYLDLREFNVKNVELKTGVSNIILKLGDKSDYSLIDVQMGVSMLEIHIPKSSGCKINYDLHIVSSNIDGFEKKNNDIYVTENYETAEKKIEINAEGGVTSFKVVRY